MKKTLLEIYALAVCFVTLICFVISLGIGLYDIIEIVNPEFTMASYKFEQHQTNDEFVKSLSKEKEAQIQGLSEEKITKLRKESYQRAIKSEKREAFQSITRIIIILFINTVVFLIHWFLAKRERVTGSSSAHT